MKAHAGLIFLFTLVLVGCAGPNPNVGERTTDVAWTSGRYSDAFKTVKPHAEAGEPWAQLRLAMFYENGWGVKSDMAMAVEWYEKAAAQKAEGAWAEGQMVGAIGRTGYFNQNSDARIAQRNLAVIFLDGKGVEKDLTRAYINIRTVVEETKGNGLFFCCEFAGGRGFPQKGLEEIFQEVVNKMSPEQKAEAEKRYAQLKKQK